MEPLHHGMFWPAALLVMVTMMTYFSLSVMAPLYFEEAAGLAASMAGVLMVAPVLANATASVLSGRALDRWGEWPLLPTGLAIAVAGLAATIAGALTSSVVVATTGIFFGYLGTGMVSRQPRRPGCAACPTSGFPRRDAHVHGRAVVGIFGAGGLYRHYELRHGSGRRSRCACRPG